MLASLNAAVQENPTDESAWLRLLSYSEEMEGIRAGFSQSACARRIAIAAQALQSIPHSIAIRTRLLNDASASCVQSEAMSHWSTALAVNVAHFGPPFLRYVYRSCYYWPSYSRGLCVYMIETPIGL